jgi:hypothetical protein
MTISIINVHHEKASTVRREHVFTVTIAMVCCVGLKLFMHLEIDEDKDGRLFPVLVDQ